MKFLCDKMLERLGRWLRAAGYDTVIISDDREDREIFEQAVKEGRYLITRDRHFLGYNGHEEVVIFLQSNDVEACAHELTTKLNIDWTHKVFSRCLICNGELREATEEEAKEAHEDVKKCYWCQQCQKLYWEGSHTDRMFKKLQEWSEE